MGAAPVTTTTLTELVNAEFISPVILAYAVDFAVAAPFCRWQDLRGKASKVGSFPQWVLDTATDTGETTDLSTTTLETTDTQITAAEIGLRRDVLDAVIEETIIGQQLFSFLIKDAATLAAVSLDDDIVALYPSFATSVGSSGTNLTIANLVEAQASIRSNGHRGMLVNVLDDQAALDYQTAAAAATSTTINSLIKLSVTGSSDSAYLGTFWGADCWSSGLTDTANTSANVVSACYIRGDTNPTEAAIGAVITRDVRVETERNASARSTEFVMTAKWGVGEICDLSAVKIVTDA